jgi:2-polyprenyl-3-methyl-5-hydroxy-6-metoxy-1,4-benzoquinol methylase
MRLVKQDWPQNGLEALGRCPVCDNPERELLFNKLIDNCFFVAPGEWTLWQCSNCQSAYLDPRPDERTIGKAYESYYTHLANEVPALSARQKLRLALYNGFRNGRYGTSFTPAHPTGYLVGMATPRFRRSLDCSFRYLPRKRPGRVLDIGCGNGEWLLLAKAAGWQVAGVDPDPTARALGGRQGLEIREGGADAWADQPETFDVITMNHVIEHVHDPLETLRTIRTLLRPGGHLFVETPNIDALGLRVHGRNWRGLEPPRHLVLFNYRSMAAALRSAGFIDIRFRRRPSVLNELSRASQLIAAGLDPYDSASNFKTRRPSLRLRLRARLEPLRSEFITVSCRRSQ